MGNLVPKETEHILVCAGLEVLQTSKIYCILQFFFFLQLIIFTVFTKLYVKSRRILHCKHTVFYPKKLAGDHESQYTVTGSAPLKALEIHSNMKLTNLHVSALVSGCGCGVEDTDILEDTFACIVWNSGLTECLLSLWCYGFAQHEYMAMSIPEQKNHQVTYSPCLTLWL